MKLISRCVAQRPINAVFSGEVTDHRKFRPQKFVSKIGIYPFHPGIWARPEHISSILSKAQWEKKIGPKEKNNWELLSIPKLPFWAHIILGPRMSRSKSKVCGSYGEVGLEFRHCIVGCIGELLQRKEFQRLAKMSLPNETNVDWRADGEKRSQKVLKVEPC